MNRPYSALAKLLAAATEKQPPHWLCLLLIMGCVTVATLFRWALSRVLGVDLPFFIYLPGIVMVGAVCGLRTGMATTVLSILAAWYFWLPPGLSWAKPDPGSWVTAALWLGVSSLIVGIIALAQELIAREAGAIRELQEKSRLLEAETTNRLHEAAAAAEQLEKIVAERTKALAETVAELEAFSYTVSHDLRSPARAMQGFSELLLAEYGDILDAKGRDYLRRIDRGAQRMDALIREVLAYSRIGRVAMATQPVNLEELIHDAVHDDAPLKKIAGDITIDRPLASVIGSPAALGQALRELLVNAAKFVAPGQKPRIRIWTEGRDAKVRVAIKDEGVGIPASALPHVFKPFHRAHSNPAYEGTGMGLAIVKRAVERQGGTVGVESEEGKGSLFWIELPATQHAPVPLAA